MDGQISRKEIKKQNKRNKRKRIFIIVASVLFVLIGGVSAYGYHIYSTAQKAVEDSYVEIDREEGVSDLREEAVDPLEDNISVLIIGVDDSEHRDYDGNSRSDALILATFSKEDHSVKLLSIPRDTYVYVPEIGQYTKINHAHFHGGPRATIETVEEFLNIPVDYFVRINFDAFIEVVDALGGIMYNVPYEMYELDSDDNQNAIHLTPGYQNLNGEEALAVARTRKYDNDFERGKRQQEIIKAIVKRAASVGSITKLDDVIRAVGNNMATNLTFDHMKSFLTYGLDTNLNIESVALEGTGGKLEDGLWYYQVDPYSRASVEKELREHLDLPIPSTLRTQLAAPEVEDNDYEYPYTN